MFNRIRVSTTLFLILILCGALQIDSNGLSFWAFRDGFQNLNQVERSNQQHAALAQTRAMLLQASTTLNKAGMLTALSYPPEDIKTLTILACDSLVQSELMFKRFMATSDSTEQGRALLGATEKNFNQWHDALVHQATQLENNQLSDFLTAPVQAAQDAFNANVNAWQSNVDSVLQAAGDQSRRNYHMSGVVFATMVVLAALLTSGALFWSRKMIVQSLAIIGNHFDSIAAGNLARPVAVYGRNEISTIFASLQKMQKASRGTVNDVRQGSSATHSGTSEIAMGSSGLSSRIEQQATALAQTAASTEQLTATVGQSADNARQASGIAKSAADTAHKGGEQTSRVISTMHKISASSQKIGGVIGVIDSITFQTNILASNAAVEAAKAGEQGCGFVVVAGEVRNLTSRSTQTAKEIKGLVEESVTRVHQGSQLVDMTSRTMTGIVSSVARVNDIMGEIASVSDEQRRGIEQVTQAVSQMDSITQQNVGLVEEVTSAAGQFATQADHLSACVAFFKLEEQTVAKQELAQPQVAPVVS